MKTFEELKCWQLAKELRKKTRVIVRSFPSEEKYRLVDQMTRCSRSITANIAEGYGRFYYLDNAKFCRMSRGSLYELIDHLIEANEENYIDENELNKLKEEIIECVTVLNGYIKYLTNKK
jgi:four helix bundle protein